MTTDVMKLILEWAGPFSTFLVGVPAVYFARKSANQLEISNKLDNAVLTVRAFEILVGHVTREDTSIDLEYVVAFSDYNVNVHKFFNKKTTRFINKYYERVYQYCFYLRSNRNDAVEQYAESDRFIAFRDEIMPKIKKELNKLPIPISEIFNTPTKEKSGFYSWFLQKLPHA
ncbi:hypothetical protein [Iodobacter fluviatilis]|uniref:Uncharacterized protein n=1 Tax=Iodobacter fluviatilis TaxID=537 RepID=A0A7G3G6T3_9NEIS|nr:hypothetical protein [Iodobacter fluviatilis]QBC42904.1 hypothetical protein C1H71_04630 [Iodobacter fluviatilis]